MASFVFDDEGLEAPRTPEHWSDVGPLHGRLGLVEQQVLSTQGQVAQLVLQMGNLSQQMREVQLQLMLQRQQNEDMMALLSQQLAGRSKSRRPGPRERQRLREANGAAEPRPEPPTELPPSEPPGSEASLERQLVTAELLVKSEGWWSHGRTTWFFLMITWLLYLVPRELPVWQHGQRWQLEEEQPPGPDNARRFVELGQLQLSVSDCQGATELFARAAALGNGTLSLVEQLALQRRLGFAQVCARRFQEALGTLQGHLEGAAAELLNAAGYAHYHLGQFHEAQTLWQRALFLAPENPVLWSNLGVVQLLSGEAEGALMQALHLAQGLGSASRYYVQLISNNIHAQRRIESGQEVRPEELHVEIFNCLDKELTVMLAATPAEELEEQYKDLAGSDGAWPVVETRRAVLETEGERMLCP